MLTWFVAEEVHDRQIEDNRESKDNITEGSCEKSNNTIQQNEGDGKANQRAAPFFVK